MSLRAPISDLAIVLSRVDYAEKDRILTLITAKHGKLRAIAKGVRAPKSKLAGGIELFAENKLVLTSGRSDLHIVTSSQMKRYFGGIAKDIELSMYAYECLKAINKLSPDNAGEEYYDSLLRLLEALDAGVIPLPQIKIWYRLKLLQQLGASPNLLTDENDQTLDSSGGFEYDFDKHCFFAKTDGAFTANHIKIMRFLEKANKPVEIKGASEELISSTQWLSQLILRGHLE